MQLKNFLTNQLKDNGMKTLALNIIVGPNDETNLIECLQAIDAGNLFDEIVICFTYTGLQGIPEELLNKLKLSYGATICFHEWTSERYPYGNFAAARNACIDSTQSDFIMWLDCDDRLSMSPAVQNLKRSILSSDRDFFMMGYLINKKEDGTFGTRFLKERIFRNRSDIRWMYPVHEQLDLKKANTMATIEGINIEHHSTKDSPLDSIDRNLYIIGHELIFAPSQHSKMFYANELMSKYRNTKDVVILNQALRCMKDCIDKRFGNDDNLAMMSYTIAIQSLPKEIDKECNVFQAELYANIALSFSDKYAEPHCVLGDCFLIKNDIARATFHYKQAMTKKLDGMSFQSEIYYEEFPARRLLDIYIMKHEPELALWYSSLVLRHSKNDKIIHAFRSEVFKILLDKEQKWLTT
jgi:hypothetical protein